MKKPEELKAFAAYVMKLIPGVKVGVGSPEHPSNVLTSIVVKHKSEIYEGMALSITITLADDALDDERFWPGFVDRVVELIAFHEDKGPHDHQDSS